MTETRPESTKIDLILSGIACSTIGDMKHTDITGLCSDSRKVLPGNLFAALEGLAHDGHQFIDQAVAAGCSALLVNRDWLHNISASGRTPEVLIVAVDNTSEALGYMAANFYGHPEQQMTMIGITGTNGKTTTSFLVESLLSSCGKRAGVIGTVNYRYTDKKGDVVVMDAPFTTPESVALFRLLRQMADADVTDVVMEVSSHGLAQGRLAGLFFDIGVFTNLSRDHLDFHADMPDYFASKKLLFTGHLKRDGYAVIVLGDSGPAEAARIQETDGQTTDWGKLLHRQLQELFHKQENHPAVITCGLSRYCDVHPQKYSVGIKGIVTEITTPCGSVSLKTPLVGEFNLQNMLCALGIGAALHENPGCMKNGLEAVTTIPGRLERITPENAKIPLPEVFVDYAHTPDALEKVLTALRSLTEGRLVCVFGCGGDRDPGKRPLMGEVTGRLCDVVITTSDNPRSELPELILSQIEAGLDQTGLPRVSARKTLEQKDGRGYDVMVSRRTAIRTAIRNAGPDDIILISGKGHEPYQINGDTKIFFDDRLEAAMHLKAASGAPPALSLDRVLQITGGYLLYPFVEPLTFTNISTDTRTIQAGDLFVGLKGENFDGGAFAEKALAKGASGLLLNTVPKASEPPFDSKIKVPVIMVPDTVTALGRLAGNLRQWYRDLQVVALTGSSGKTTVKEMTGAILSLNHQILKTEGNFNNLIGLPLTLFRLQPEHEIAVLEMGMNRPGEIEWLTEIADPDVACIINVQEAHLEGLGDIQGVARAKNELFEGLRPEARIVVNLDDEIVSSLAVSRHQEQITFGCHPDAFVQATDIRSLAEEGMQFSLRIGSTSRKVLIRALGRHNVTNSLAAGAMAYACGCSIDEICRGLESFEPYDKRARIEVLASGMKILNDCYNANPASMKAALETTADLKKNHRAVAILGDMLELGSKSDEAHVQLGRTAGELGFDFLAAFGSQAEKIAVGARQAGMAAAAAQGFTEKAALVSWLNRLMRQNIIKPGDWFLVKGSRGMRMEEVIALIRRHNKRIEAEGN